MKGVRSKGEGKIEAVKKVWNSSECREREKQGDIPCPLAGFQSFHLKYVGSASPLIYPRFASSSLNLIIPLFMICRLPCWRRNWQAAVVSGVGSDIVKMN